MSGLLDGERVPFRTAAERKALIGKRIKYLRHCDIDRSGRGYFFPRVGIVIDAQGRQLIFDCGNSVAASDLAEVVVLPAPPPPGAAPKQGET